MTFVIKGLPHDVLSSTEVGERALKVALDTRLTSEGNTKDRLLTQGLDYRDDVISKGLAHYLDYHQTSIASGAKTYAQVTTPPGFYVALIDRELVTDREKAFFKVYTDYGAVTESTNIAVKPLRMDSIYPSGVLAKVCTTPATINQDSVISHVCLFGSVSSGNRASGGINANAVFRLFPPSTSLLIEWDNQSSTSIYFETSMAWLELPESVIIN